MLGIRFQNEFSLIIKCGVDILVGDMCLNQLNYAQGDFSKWIWIFIEQLVRLTIRTLRLDYNI